MITNRRYLCERIGAAETRGDVQFGFLVFCIALIMFDNYKRRGYRDGKIARLDKAIDGSVERAGVRAGLAKAGLGVAVAVGTLLAAYAAGRGAKLW